MPSLVRELRRRNVSALLCEVDPTAANGDTGKVLPKGATPLAIQSLGGATGGSSPTVDVGIEGNGDYFHDELDADTLGGPIALNGDGKGLELAAPTPVYAGVGASAATGGTTSFVIWYLISSADGAGE